MSSIKQKPQNSFLASFFSHFSPFSKYKIIGTSMIPTYHDGEIVYVNRAAYLFMQPHRQDIVACLDPRDKKVLIKRIVKIENEQYFVQGDNKFGSTDSREFGMIERSAILGKVLEKRS